MTEVEELEPSLKDMDHILELVECEPGKDTCEGCTASHTLRKACVAVPPLAKESEAMELFAKDSTATQTVEPEPPHEEDNELLNECYDSIPMSNAKKCSSLLWIFK